VVCVDDLMIASKDPDSIIKMLMEKHQFKLKGTGPTKFHLGCGFFRDEEGVLCHAPKKHIKKILENCRRIFGTWPKPATSPLTAGDHPELDASELLNEHNQKACQSLIGAPQWAIQIGRFDIQTTVMTLSRCRAVPRQGHLDRVKKIHGCLLRCTMLQSRSGLTHLIIRTFQSSCVTGNAPAVLMKRKKFLWMLLHQKESR